jgi:hypothetical protein
MTLQPLVPTSAATATGESRSTNADEPYLEGVVPEENSYLQGIAPTEEEGWPDQDWDFGLDLPGGPGPYDGPSHIDGRVLSEDDDIFVHNVMRFIAETYADIRTDVDPFSPGDRIGAVGMDVVVAAATGIRPVGVAAEGTGVEVSASKLLDDVLSEGRPQAAGSLPVDGVGEPGIGPPDLAAGGAKSLGEAVGAENVGLTNQVLKGKQPLEALSDAQRQAAADFYRGVAERTTGNLSEAAAEFNRLRADFLEGKTTEVPGNINDFIARRGLPRK